MAAQDYKITINLRGSFANAQMLPQLMLKYESDIDLSVDNYVVDAKSLFGVLSLTTGRDLTITVHEKVEGEAKEIYRVLADNGLLVED